MLNNHDLQLILNKSISKLAESFNTQPTFKTTEINNGIKTEIFLNSSYPVSVGFVRGSSYIDNFVYINSMLEAIKNLDISLVE